jgi:hypothetical protein
MDKTARTRNGNRPISIVNGRTPKHCALNRLFVHEPGSAVEDFVPLKSRRATASRLAFSASCLRISESNSLSVIFERSQSKIQVAGETSAAIAAKRVIALKICRQRNPMLRGGSLGVAMSHA